MNAQPQCVSTRPCITYQSVHVVRLFVHHQQRGALSTLSDHFHHTVVTQRLYRLAIDGNYEVIGLQASLLCWTSGIYVFDDLT